MSAKLDELDLKIIRKLQINGRASVTELAEEAGSSRPTVTSARGVQTQNPYAQKSNYSLVGF